jgi:hypothetical protein
MGIFNDADQHPFHELAEDDVVDETRGKPGSEAWREERRRGDYVLPVYATKEAA